MSYIGVVRFTWNKVHFGSRRRRSRTRNGFFEFSSRYKAVGRFGWVSAPGRRVDLVFGFLDPGRTIQRL